VILNEQVSSYAQQDLQLIGTSDWNDGMNRVGHAGQGESVWLGWFLHTTLWECARLADTRGEHQHATTGVEPWIPTDDPVDTHEGLGRRPREADQDAVSQEGMRADCRQGTCMRHVTSTNIILSMSCTLYLRITEDRPMEPRSWRTVISSLTSIGIVWPRPSATPWP
jgi:hypothetical protein